MASFQTFERATDATRSAERLADLREWMADRKLDAFIVPRADEHQNEYVPERAERLRWLTGFAGSAGTAIVLTDHAVLFVDGRYTIQAAEETDPNQIEIVSSVETSPTDWLARQRGSHMRIGIDPWLYTIGQVRALQSKLPDAEIVKVDENPVDAIWPNQPPAPLGQVRIHPLERSGELAADKLETMSETIGRHGFDATVLTDPASIAWTFNIRGSDVPHTPLPLSFAIVRAEGEPTLFLDRRKLDRETHAYLNQIATLADPSKLTEALEELAEGSGRIGLDPDLCAQAVADLLAGSGGETGDLTDPASIPRATKNTVELDGSRQAHKRDGAAMARFLAWLQRQPVGSVDEITAVTRLENLRKAVGEETEMELQDISFDTISGSGPHGAVVHYRVSRQSNRTLNEGELYLVDSGGQYLDGTTDVTRTVPVGEASPDMIRHATIVLKGLIALSRCRFPKGSAGREIDPIARAPLWANGMDYAHGTGHGVGSYLSVHEGPARISKTGKQELLPGMILSNEPGFYLAGQYGIRLENLIAVRDLEPIEGGDRPMMAFETLTLVPFDRRLIDPSLLEPGEIEWLDRYHARVLEAIEPLLRDDDDREWLKKACAPIA